MGWGPGIGPGFQVLRKWWFLVKLMTMRVELFSKPEGCVCDHALHPKIIFYYMPCCVIY